MLSHTSELLSSGELLQIEKSLNDSMDEETYYNMIWAKTASLFATSCKVGALTVSASDREIAALSEYGRCLGLAFQIRDDLFDCTGTSARTGKPVARDIKANLITLPLIHALKKMPSATNRRIRYQLRNAPSRRQIDEIIKIIAENGGLIYAEQKCAELTRRRQSLDMFRRSRIQTA
jgi:octaprenyl-diphosphate synthase